MGRFHQDRSRLSQRHAFLGSSTHYTIAVEERRPHRIPKSGHGQRPPTDKSLGSLQFPQSRPPKTESGGILGSSAATSDVRFIDNLSAAVGNVLRTGPDSSGWACSGSTSCITREGIGNSGPGAKCESCGIGRLSSRTGNAPSVAKSSQNYNDVVPDHRNPKGMGGAWRDDPPGQHSSYAFLV